MKKLYFTLIIGFTAINSSAQYGQLPNGGFESWENQLLYENPDVWGSSNTDDFFGVPAVEKSTDAQDGALSVKISSIQIGQDTLSGYVFHGNVGGSGPDQGIPYTDNFEAVSFQYKSNMSVGDTAFFYIIRFNGGAMVQFDILPITYSTVNSWTPELLYVGNTIQDSLFIAFTMGNPMYQIKATPGSWVMIDNVQFLAGGITTAPIPNPSFEDWTQTNVENASNWFSLNFFLASFGAENANKTTDAYSGQYAIEMTTTFQSPDTIASLLSTAPINLFNPFPFSNSPYSASPTTFSGAYKYSAANGDQAGIQIEFFQAGVSIGMHYETFSNQTSWTTFSSPLTYTGTPDSMRFMVYSGDNPGSVLKLDDLMFSGGNVGLNENALIDFGLYPNPANNYTIIALPEEGSFSMQISSLDGKTVVSEENINGIQHVSLQDLNKGIYIIRIIDGSMQLTKKLVVE